MVFRFLVILLLIVLNYFFVARTFRTFSKTKKWAINIFSLFLAIYWQFYYRLFAPDPNSIFLQIYFWISGVYFGWLVIAISISLIVFILNFLLDLISKKIAFEYKSKRIHPNLSRRNFFQSTLPIGVGTVFSGLGAKTVMEGPYVNRLSLSVNKELSPELKALNFIQISDLHVGPTIIKSHVENLVSQINSQNPDIIFFTGDFADGTPEQLSTSINSFRRLSAKHKIFVILGNHEYYWGVDLWIKQFEDWGWTLLLNQSYTMQFGSSQLLVCGIPDQQGHLFNHKIDFVKTFPKESASKNETRIFLSHRPDIILKTDPFEFDIQLSGHTHAGQFFPFTVAISLFHRFSKGLYKYKDKLIYVNAGTGYWATQNRFLNRAEVTAFNLIESSNEII